MKKIVAINCSPRTVWNTATLVREAAKGAENEGAEVKIIDLYKIEKFTGCITLWNFQQQFLRKERKLMTVLSCPKCGILKQGVPEDLDEFAEEILDEM